MLNPLKYELISASIFRSLSIKLSNSKLYSNYAENIRKLYNLDLKKDLTNSTSIVSKTDHLNWLEIQKKKKQIFLLLRD